MRSSIVLCTIEKAYSLLNAFLRPTDTVTMRQTRMGVTALSALGCVVIDELHTLGDRSRGHLLEILVR